MKIALPRWLLMLILTFSLAACQAVMHEKGVIIDPKAVAEIQPGLTTQLQVQELLGSPTIVNVFKKERWIYIHDRQYKNIQRTFSRVANRVEITFDNWGIVKTIHRNFGEDILDPETVPGADNRPGTSWWAWFLDWENDSAIPAFPRPEYTANWEVPTPMKDASAKSSHHISKRRPLWKRLLLIRDTPATVEKSTPPSTKFGSDEDGWWQDVWDSDPTTAQRGNTGEESPSEPEGDSKAWWPF
ncbi:MAG: outer membrane protein assembly factor BamE [Magnetococcales bacterium]|nr:outer membrane protein assembly factor BamE [Magnetococcales bacterium]